MSEERERIAKLQFVSIECMPPLTISNKSFAASGYGIFIGSYNFCNARKRFHDVRYIFAQIN